MRKIRSRSMIFGLVMGLGVTACAGTSDEAGNPSGSGGAGGTGANGTGASGGHGCFSTETTCDGKCVDVMIHPEHCGECGRSCASGPDSVGTCVAGECSASCASGFGDDGGICKNFLGAHEEWPAECAGCAIANAYTGACACPAPASALALHVQSDCPGVPMRAKTELHLCPTGGLSSESDFGGAYQVDDFDGWCGATAQCRVGNPLAGGSCSCPDGFGDTVSLRSIIRLPCDNAEAGTTIVICGNAAAPYSSYAGAFQVDDFAPNCRVSNPWTGDCSCPDGSNDRAYRVMVDGAMGLYGSAIHLCIQ